jgi:hypothetical protein
MKKTSKEITTFDTFETAKQAGRDIAAALQKFATSRGLSIMFEKVDNVYADRMKVSFKVSVIKETAKLAAEAAAQRQEYIEKAESLGLKLEWLDEWFIAGRGRSENLYTIVGLDTSNAKFPVVTQTKRGQERVNVTLDGVKEGMERHEQLAKERADRLATK